jgi:hypothetical protein
MLSLGKCDQIDQDLNKLCFSCFVPKGGYIICLMLSLYLGPKVITLSGVHYNKLKRNKFNGQLVKWFFGNRKCDMR